MDRAFRDRGQPEPTHSAFRSYGYASFCRFCTVPILYLEDSSVCSRSILNAETHAYVSWLSNVSGMVKGTEDSAYNVEMHQQETYRVCGVGYYEPSAYWKHCNVVTRRISEFQLVEIRSSVERIFS